jgi:hypothetical protein
MHQKPLDTSSLIAYKQKQKEEAEERGSAKGMNGNGIRVRGRRMVKI